MLSQKYLTKITDCTPQGNMFNSNYLNYLIDSIYEYLRIIGVDIQLLSKQNVLLFVRKTDVKYIKSLTLNSEFYIKNIIFKMLVPKKMFIP